MNELRFNVLRAEHVDYAIHRQERTFLPQRDHCPLCPTHAGGPETEIPRAAFEIAVFDNRFPAFEAPLGASEVIVYTDDHDASFGTIPLMRAEDLMWVWRHRYLELGSREDVDYVFIFENRGVEVGVTLHHPHGQIYGYPFLPPVPALELEADSRLGSCAPCALLQQELAQGQRIVYEDEAVVAYVPYAARWPYETHMVTREHRPSLLECEGSELQQLAAGLQALARGYDALFDRPFPYMMVVHQAPTEGMHGRREEAARRGSLGSPSAHCLQGAPSSQADRGSRGGHLHVEFYTPLRSASKLKYLAGSEQGAGAFISDTLPERSAAQLRAAIERAL